MPQVSVHSMAGHAEWVEVCAAWWHAQWGEWMGYTPESARDAITALTLPGKQAALIALLDGIPAGSVFLIDNDLESRPELTPWLAGLFVLPEARRQGVGEALVSAVLAHATSIGYETVFLYSAIGGFYRRLGWESRETLILHELEHEIMSYSLPIPSRP